MSNEIITPIALWRDFDGTLPLKTTVLNQSILNGVVYDEIYFSGRQTKVGRVRVYAANFRPQEGELKGSLLIINDVFSEIDKSLAIHFAKQGLNVLSIDLRGAALNVQNYTKYPEDVCYANAKDTKNTFYFCENGAKETCWYEWVSASKYAVKYLKSTNGELPLSAIGVKHGANVLWQLTMSEPDIKGSIYLFGCGWLAYKDLPKFSEGELKMDDERYRYLAAVDAQAYAQYAQNKTLYLTTLNSKEFDLDRACDTLLRIPNQDSVFLEFYPKSDEGLDNDLLQTVSEFINSINDEGKFKFNVTPQIKIEVDEETFCAYVTANTKENVKNAVCYYAFNSPISKFRAWLKKDNFEKIKSVKNGEVFRFKLPVYDDVSVIHAYVEFEYYDGVKLSSSISYKNVTINSPLPCPSILYGASGLNAEFIKCVDVDVDKTETYVGFDGAAYRNAFIEKGVYETSDTPLNIKGVKINSCSVKTYAIRRLNKKSLESCVVKFDVFLDASAELSITLETTCGDYNYNISLLSGKAWQNLILPVVEFKNDKLVGYSGEDLLSIKFTVNGSVVINNLLIL